MGHDIDPRLLQSVDEQRRDFLRKLILGSAFVAPAIASFPMDSLAVDQTTIRNGNIRLDLDTKKDPSGGTTLPGTTSTPAKR